MKIFSFEQENINEQNIKKDYLFNQIINKMIEIYEKSNCGCLCNNIENLNEEIKDQNNKSEKLNLILEKANELKKDLPSKIMNLENNINILKNKLLEKLGADI